MARKRYSSPDPKHETPQKKRKYRSEEKYAENDIASVPTLQSSSVSRKRRRDSTDSTQSPQSPKSPKSLAAETPFTYTSEFFFDLADTIARTFPFEEFAKMHNCDVADVSHAIGATVVGPLSDPEFQWHQDRDMTIADYGRNMIMLWKKHYQWKLENTDVPANGASSRKSSEPAVTVASSKDEIYEPNGSTRTSPERPRTEAPSEIANTETSESKSCPRTNQEAKKSSNTASDFPRIPRWQARRNSTRVPVQRQDVYKDNFGNYVPVIPKEEISLSSLQSIARLQRSRIPNAFP